MTDVVESLAHVVDRFGPECAVGLYLYGSSVQSGLRPDSDLDLLLVTRRSLTAHERTVLLEFLLARSGTRASDPPRRPLEVTSVELGELSASRYPPRCDFLYGEWLREEFAAAAGALPQPHETPDLVILLATLRQRSHVLRGPKPADFMPPIDPAQLRQAIGDSLPSLLRNWSGDERNVLLTLARMIVTLESGDIVAKDEAAHRLMSTLPGQWQPVLELASAAYAGDREDNWAGMEGAVGLAKELAGRVSALLAPDSNRPGSAPDQASETSPASLST